MARSHSGAAVDAGAGVRRRVELALARVGSSRIGTGVDSCSVVVKTEDSRLKRMLRGGEMREEACSSRRREDGITGREWLWRVLGYEWMDGQSSGRQDTGRSGQETVKAARRAGARIGRKGPGSAGEGGRVGAAGMGCLGGLASPSRRPAEEPGVAKGTGRSVAAAETSDSHHLSPLLTEALS